MKTSYLTAVLTLTSMFGLGISAHALSLSLEARPCLREHTRLAVSR
jgi:hypothetical protein